MADPHGLRGRLLAITRALPFGDMRVRAGGPPRRHGDADPDLLVEPGEDGHEPVDGVREGSQSNGDRVPFWAAMRAAAKR